MDIYEIEMKEGRDLICELEKLRCIRKKGSVTVKCAEKQNNWMEYLRRQYLLGNDLRKAFYEAKSYYLFVGDNTVAVSAVYDVCHIVYYLRGEKDWKLIEVEILSLAYCINMDEICDKVAGRVESITLLMLAELSHQYGFSRVFKYESPENLRRLFKEIVNNKVLNEHDLNLRAKIARLISKNGLREEFVPRI